MATSSQFRDIDENFKCSICLEQFKEPKVLTCLHRYCKECLGNLIRASRHDVFTCPECREEIKIPFTGVDGFKTDFLCKSVIELLQKSRLPAEPPLTGEGHRCKVHNENMSEFVCLTCNNCRVCKRCTSGAHKEHEIVEVATLVEIERKKLTEALKILQKIEERKRKLYESSKIETQNLVGMCENDVKEITLEIEQIREQIQQVECRGDNTKQKKLAALKRAEEEKIQEIMKEYKNLREKRERDIEEHYKALNEPHNKELAKLYKKRKELNNGQKLLIESIKTKLKDKVRNIEEISEPLDTMIKLFDNIYTTVTSSLTPEKGLVALRTEIDSLTMKMKIEYKRLEKEKFFDIKVDYRDSVFRRKRAPSITGHAVTTKNIEAIGSGWYIDGIASNDEGITAITGSTEDNKSFIIVIDTDGLIVRRKTFSRNVLKPGKRRFCEFLSKSKIASVYQHDEIGIYDVGDDSYRKIVSDFNVTCMAIDAVNDIILVGNDKTEVYMFDFQLFKRHRKLALPQIIEGPRDISVHNGDRLLVCDYDGKRIYETTLEGSESRAEYELSRPDLDGEDWKPFCLCTDKYRCIYTLWMTGEKFSTGRRILVQYSDDGRKLRETKEVDRDSRCVTVVDQESGGKLLIATWKTAKLYSYGLKYENEKDEEISLLDVGTVEADYTQGMQQQN